MEVGGIWTFGGGGGVLGGVEGGLGVPPDPPLPLPTPSGLASIARTMEAYSKYWSGLRGGECDPPPQKESLQPPKTKRETPNPREVQRERP